MAVLTTPMQLGPTSRIPLRPGQIAQLGLGLGALATDLAEAGAQHDDARDARPRRSRRTTSITAAAGTATTASSIGSGTSLTVG